MELEDFLGKLAGVQRSGSGWAARCPAHDDHVASLQVTQGEHQPVVLFCHAGCRPEDVVSSLGLSMADLGAQPHVVARYAYQRVDGSEAYTVERWANPKTFRGYLPPPSGRMIYRLPWVQWAIDHGQTIYVVEGEKDAETVSALGLVATTNTGGAGKWLPHYADQLAGAAHVIVVADNDQPGINHGRNVAQSLDGKVAQVELVRPLYGKDVTELLEAGFGLDHVTHVPLDAPVEAMNAHEVTRKAQRWAWEPYVPAGTITIIEGDPGEGKSTLTMDLVARWTTRVPMPDGAGHGEPVHAIMITAEDDPATTLKPRLEAAGGDPRLVTFVVGGATPGAPFSLTAVDLAGLATIIEARKTGVIILDPLMAAMPAKVDGMVDADVRRALYPLKLLAETYGLAVIVVRHLVKSATRALYAGSGSIGIVGAARAAYMVKRSPSNPDQVILACQKSNLAKRPPALAFRLVDTELGVARLEWDGVVSMTVDDLFNPDPAQETRAAQAHAWLTNRLRVATATWKTLVTEAKAQGFTEITLRRGRDQGGFRTVVNPTMAGIVQLGTWWVLDDPDHPWPFDTVETLATESGGVAPLLTTREHAPEMSTESKDATESDGPEEGSEEWALIQNGRCTVCGEPTGPMVQLGATWYVRCTLHDARGPYGV